MLLLCHCLYASGCPLQSVHDAMVLICAAYIANVDVHLCASAVGCGDVREHIIYPRFIGVIYPDQGDPVPAFMYTDTVRSLYVNFDQLLHLHLTQYTQPRWREMLAEINARGTFKLHSHHVIAAQPEIVDLCLDDVEAFDRSRPDNVEALDSSTPDRSAERMAAET